MCQDPKQSVAQSQSYISAIELIELNLAHRFSRPVAETAVQVSDQGV